MISYKISQKETALKIISLASNGGKCKMNNVKSFLVLFSLILSSLIIFDFSVAQSLNRDWWYDDIEFINTNDTLFMKTRNSGEVRIESIWALINKDSSDALQIFDEYKRRYHSKSSFRLNIVFDNTTQSEVNFICKSISLSQWVGDIITKLSINNCNLDSLPYIYDFSKVEEIYFFNTEIKSISRLSYMDIITVKTLLSFMDGFPKGFDKINNIIKLKMDFTYYERSISGEVPRRPITVDYYDELQKFRKRKNLRYLSIKGLDFNKYPDYLFEFLLLNNLLIECSKLSDLPEAIKIRQNEIIIDISATSIKNIPDWASKLDYNIKFWVNKEQRDLNKIRFNHHLYWDGADFGNRRVSLFEIINDVNDE